MGAGEVGGCDFVDLHSPTGASRGEHGNFMLVAKG